MKPSYEKLIPDQGVSFRCFERSGLRSPVKWHRHPEIELTYVHRGSGTRLVGDHIGTYGNHDLVLLGADLPHTWLSDENRGKRYDRHPAYVVQFHPEFLGSRFFEAPELSRVANMLEMSRRGLWFPAQFAEQLGQLIVAMIEQDRLTRLIDMLACLQRLSEFAEPVLLASESYSPPANAKTETRVRMIFDYISQRLTDPGLCHAELANFVDMNGSAFSRFFKQTTGRCVTEYVNELRIGLVCRQLIDTDDAILDICNQSGFNNVSNFNRLFREMIGVSPREYRKTHRAVGDD